MSSSIRYKVRYAEVPAEAIKGRIVRNPNYPGASLGIYGWVGIPQISKHRKPAFRAALGESLKTEGFRNPVVLYGTAQGLYVSFGGSRVQAAIDHALPTVKAIINDYTGEWNDCEEVTAENWQDFFTDVPEWHEFGERGFDYHYSLERNRRATYDSAGFAWAEDPEEFKHEFPWVTKWT